MKKPFLIALGICQGVRVLMMLLGKNTEINTGIFFIPVPALISLTISIGLLYFLWYLVTADPIPKKLATPVAVLMGGIASNVLDRCFYSGVCDYFYFGFMTANITDFVILTAIIWTAVQIRK